METAHEFLIAMGFELTPKEEVNSNLTLEQSNDDITIYKGLIDGTKVTISVRNNISFNYAIELTLLNTFNSPFTGEVLKISLDYIVTSLKILNKTVTALPNLIENDNS